MRITVYIYKHLESLPDTSSLKAFVSTDPVIRVTVVGNQSESEWNQSEIGLFYPYELS